VSPSASAVPSLDEALRGPGSANVGKILFSSTHASPGSYRLYTVNPDGTGLTPFSDVTTADELDPVWSPDFRRIAFTRRRTDGDVAIFVMNEDGTRSEFIHSGRRPRWSPNGRHLVFGADDKTGNLEIFVSRPKSSAISGVSDALTDTPEYELDPTWSPDGSRIAFVRYDGDAEIWVMNADGTGAERIASCTNDGAFCGSLSWSPVPGDERIAYAMSGGVNELRIVDATTKAVTTVLTESRPTALAPSWAPDASRIAFFSHRDAALESDNGDIYTVKPDGTDIQRVTQLRAPLGQPGWSR
jgi:Tol biopolymer transport system component